MQKFLLAVAQMCSTNDIENNFRVVEQLCKEASQRGASVVCFPENFAFLGHFQDATRMAEPLTGPLFSRYATLASTYGLEISFGGFQEKAPENRVYNAHVYVNNEGEIGAIYRKIHLFVVNINDETSFNEAAHVVPGNDVVVAQSQVGMLGLSICYDLRFAELYGALRKRESEVLLVPAAFTAETGKAHWEVLLRARAIENQCYVAAAAQYGTHYKGRVTHGHAMIVDPWGTIVAQCSDQQGLAIAEIDLDYLHRLRQSMPMHAHRRSDIFEDKQ